QTVAVEFDDAQAVVAVEHHRLGLGEGRAVDLHVQRLAGQLVQGDHAVDVDGHQVLQGDFAGTDFQSHVHRDLAEEAQILLRQALGFGRLGQDVKRQIGRAHV